MSLAQILIFTLVCALLSSSSAAMEIGEPDLLFQDESVIAVTLEAPLTTVFRERSLDDQYPATLRYRDVQGSSVEVPLRIRARGNFRRNPDNCRFPPIRLRFRSSEVEGTIFEGLSRVPLVTHCQNSSRYEQGVLREYIAYRILNELTDMSLRARLFRITYIDTDGGMRDRETYGFAIEHRNRLAERSGIPALETERTRIANLDAEYLNLSSVFQFLIGNTDFSPIFSTEGSRCCHNHRLFGAKKNAPVQYSVPFDFDMTGIVDLPHSSPAPALNIRSVTQRRYRGRCVNNELIPQTLEQFMDKREAILNLVENLQGATRSTKRALRRFIERFYAIIENPRQVERQLVNRCI